MSVDLETLRADRMSTAWRAAQRLTVLRPVVDDPPGRSFIRLIAELSGPPGAGAEAYLELATDLWRRAAVAAPGADPVGDLYQNHLLERLLAVETPFSLAAERGGLDAVPPALAAGARADLQRLQALFRLDAGLLRRLISAGAGDAPEDWPWWGGMDAGADTAHSAAPPAPADPFAADRRALKQRLAAAGDWADCIGDLARHHATAGAGRFGRYLAFRLQRTATGLVLVGSADPDPIRLSDLVGYDAARAEVTANTEHFLAGRPAQNLLLYGERGTGKSSTVKALAHAYGRQGLRLVQVPRSLLTELPGVLRALRRRSRRFILFIDDLSFEEHEVGYKDLKSALEGSIERQPPNVILYVTSNRRHLVREAFTDRHAADEVRPQDILQEKLSLSDRFGKTVIFPEPDQELYLRIVSNLVQQRGLRVPSAELETMALRWALWHNGRSGRTARQFVDHLEAEMPAVPPGSPPG